LKIHIELPGGGKFDFERQPMQLDKFYALCYVAGGALAVILIVSVTYIRA